MPIAIVTDTERDRAAEEAIVREYLDKYGELGWLVQQIEEDVLTDAWNTYTNSRGQMEDRLRQWSDDLQRYRAAWRDGADDTPFMDLYSPKIARIVDIHVARTMQGLFPDRMRMDFFTFSPETDYMGEPVDPAVMEYAQAAENGVRNDMINGRFVPEMKTNLFNLFATGNFYAMLTWEMRLQYRYTRVPNPEYDPEVPYRVDMVKGKPVVTPIEPEIMVREAYREFDAPRMRALNPLNVFPSELDRDNAEDCAAISIYDTVYLSDLLDEEIETGGYLYANLNRVKYCDQRYDVPEIADRLHGDIHPGSYTTVESTKKLDRINVIGRFRLAEKLDKYDLTDAQKRKLIKIFTEKYKWDEDKITGWNNWIIEIVNEGYAMVRWQPLPFVVDKKNIVHMQLFPTPNQTISESIYDRCRTEETVANAQNRYTLENVLKNIRPRLWVDVTAVDEKWRMLNGDNYSWSPNQVAFLKQGKSVRDAVQYEQIPSAAVQYADIAMSNQLLAMSEAAHLPPVKMGSATGGATASEINNMGSSADLILQEFILGAEDALSRIIGWMLKLHHQYTDSVRIGVRVDQRGDVIMEQVDPNVWIHQYRVNLNGFQQTGNLAIRAMNFKEFATWLQSTGWANVEQIASEYTKILQLKNGMAMIQQPEPPAPPLSEKTNLSISVTPDQLGASATAEVLRTAGVNVTPDMEAEMGVIKDLVDEAATLEATREDNDAAMASDQYLSSNAPNGGSPAGVPEAQPSNYAPGSHHAPGEVETRQRGVKDTKGAVASMSQKLRSPANSRRANP